MIRALAQDIRQNEEKLLWVEGCVLKPEPLASAQADNGEEPLCA